MGDPDGKKSSTGIGSCSRVSYQLPVDRGWAWFVLLGATCNVMVLMMFLRATSLLFIQFLEMYQASATMTTLVFALASVTFSISNIVSSIVLLKRYEVRTLGIAGSLVNFVSILGIAFAPNIALVNSMFAIMGFSHGLMIVPQITLLGHYFKRRLSLATATTTIGISLATIFGTPLTQLLLDTYGVRGTVLLLAGITLHCFPASMLLRPVSFYDAVGSEDQNQVQRNTESGLKDKCVEDENDSAEDKGDESPFLGQETKLNGERETASHKNGKKTTSSGNLSEHDKKSFAKLKTPSRDTSAPRMLSIRPPSRVRSISENWHIPSKRTNYHNHLHSNLDIFIENDDSEYENVAGHEKNAAAMKTSVSGILSASIRYLSDTSSFYGSSVFQIHRLGDVKDHSTPDSENYQAVESSSTECMSSSESQSKSHGKIERNFFHRFKQSASQSIYTHPISILILLASGLGIHTQAGVAYMPATGIENGLSEEQVPLLLTVFGVSDVISKLGVGFLADTGILRRIYIACLSQLITGVLFQTVPLFQGFLLMTVLQALLGLTVGVFHVLVPVITVDVLGVQHMGHITAGYLLISGITNSVDHLIVGSFSDLTGSFYGAYHYMGSLTLLSITLLVSEPLLERCLQRSDKTEGEAENEEKK